MKLRKRIEFFYSPFCPTCPKAKEVVREVAEEYKIDLEEINILSPDAQKRYEEYEIKGVPCTVINGGHKIFGVPPKEAIVDYLYENK